MISILSFELLKSVNDVKAKKVKRPDFAEGLNFLQRGMVQRYFELNYWSPKAIDQSPIALYVPL